MQMFSNFEFGAVQNCVDLVDLVKSFPTIPIPTSMYYLLAKIGVDTVENGPLNVFGNSKK